MVIARIYDQKTSCMVHMNNNNFAYSSSSKRYLGYFLTVLFFSIILQGILVSEYVGISTLIMNSTLY